MKSNKFIEYLVAFLALIGLGALISRKTEISAPKENKKVDEKMNEIKEEVNATSTDDLVADYNKRHGKRPAGDDA